VKLPAGNIAGETMKGIGKTGPCWLSVPMVKVVVLCSIPGPVYRMAAAAGIVIKNEWFAGMLCITLKDKLDVLATHTAPAQKIPC